MSASEMSKICCICRKLFCCAECRLRHETRKHSSRLLNCPLCCSQALPLQFFEDQELLCHVVINHLPLYCRLCGDTFRQSKDLESYGTCKWWQSRHRHSLISDRKSLAGTPPLAQQEKGAEQLIVNGEYRNNYDTWTSPPELHRNTSTPMVLGQKSNLEFKTPVVPNFTLKTPTPNSTVSTKHQISSFEISVLKDENSDTKFFSFPTLNQEDTPFRSLPLQEEDSNISRINSGRKLDVMKEQEEEINSDNYCLQDMDLTGIENEVLPDLPNAKLHDKAEKRSDSIKKVRFSDQYDDQTQPAKNEIFNMTENDEFFEAQETMGGPKESTHPLRTMINDESKQSTSKYKMKIDEESEESSRESIETSETGINKVGSGTTEKENLRPSGTSSRVVMMVVVQNNNSNVESADLINSELKKLKRFASNACHSISNRSSPGCNSTFCETPFTSVNSYCSVSDDECYSISSGINAARRETSLERARSSSTSGIFSAVTHAVKSVMKNFSGPSRSKETSMREIRARDDTSPRASNAEASNTISNLISSRFQRPGKRSRDVIENMPSMSREMDVVLPQIELRSPLAKRYRGWSRIKAREPIARMRSSQVTSPRGVSLETQVFSQGSLSVRDTVLPLPARAHQSTQTEG